jgi:hypothetical protein
MTTKEDQMQRRTLLKSSAAALCAHMAAPSLQAQTLPTGNVRIVVGFPPGGGGGGVWPAATLPLLAEIDSLMSISHPQDEFS